MVLLADSNFHVPVHCTRTYKVNGNIQQCKLTFLINKRKNSDMIHIAETFMKIPFLHFQFTFPLARWIFCTTSANTMWLSWGIWLCNFFHFGLASRF